MWLRVISNIQYDQSASSSINRESEKNTAISPRNNKRLIKARSVNVS